MYFFGCTDYFFLLSFFKITSRVSFAFGNAASKERVRILCVFVVNIQ